VVQPHKKEQQQRRRRQCPKFAREFDRTDERVTVDVAVKRHHNVALLLGCQGRDRSLRPFAQQRASQERLTPLGRESGLRLLPDPQSLANLRDEAGHSASLRRFAGVENAA
jgi:hypothetical protein